MKVTIPFKPRLLVPAGLLASTFVLGGGAFGDPAVACAEPNSNEFNEAGYQVCSESADEALTAGKITTQQWNDLLAWCCQEHGGRHLGPGHCIAADIRSVPGAVDHPTDAATQPPPPPRLPVVPPPTAIATVPPQPAAPPTTSTLAPPPPR
jgi:hypothetical protein